MGHGAALEVVPIRCEKIFSACRLMDLFILFVQFSMLHLLRVQTQYCAVYLNLDIDEIRHVAKLLLHPVYSSSSTCNFKCIASSNFLWRQISTYKMKFLIHCLQNNVSHFDYNPIYIDKNLNQSFYFVLCI